MCLSWWKVPYGGKNSLHAEGLRYLSALSYPITLVLQKNDGRESCSSQYEYEVGQLANSPVSITQRSVLFFNKIAAFFCAAATRQLGPKSGIDPNMRWKY